MDKTLKQSMSSVIREIDFDIYKKYSNLGAIEKKLE